MIVFVRGPLFEILGLVGDPWLETLGWRPFSWRPFSWRPLVGDPFAGDPFAGDPQSKLPAQERQPDANNSAKSGGCPS